MPCFCFRCNFRSYFHEHEKLQYSHWETEELDEELTCLDGTTTALTQFWLLLWFRIGSNDSGGIPAPEWKPPPPPPALLSHLYNRWMEISGSQMMDVGIPGAVWWDGGYGIAIPECNGDAPTSDAAVAEKYGGITLAKPGKHTVWDWFYASVVELRELRVEICIHSLNRKKKNQSQEKSSDSLHWS